jgi:hypothetical protein
MTFVLFKPDHQFKVLTDEIKNPCQKYFDKDLIIQPQLM